MALTCNIEVVQGGKIERPSCGWLDIGGDNDIFSFGDDAVVELDGDERGYSGLSSSSMWWWHKRSWSSENSRELKPDLLPGFIQGGHFGVERQLWTILPESVIFIFSCIDWQVWNFSTWPPARRGMPPFPWLWLTQEKWSLKVSVTGDAVGAWKQRSVVAP